MQVDFDTIEMNLNALPSKLWAVHSDSFKKYIAILHVNITDNEINIDKGIVLYNKKNELSSEANIFIHNRLTDVPHINTKVSNAEELLQLITEIDMMNLCEEYKEINESTCAVYCDKIGSSCCSNCIVLNTKESDKNRQVSYTDPVCGNIIVNEISQDFLSESDILQNKFSTDDSISCLTNFSNSYSFKNESLSQITSSHDFYKSNNENTIYSLEMISNQTKHICHTCGDAFISPEMLNIHLSDHIETDKINTDDQPEFLENICSQNHINKEESVSDPIKTVDINDKSKRRLRKKTDDRLVQCELCKKIITSVTHLKIHMRRHTGERPFSCEVCEKRFFTKSHLKEHHRTHTKERPYVCPICNKTSSYQSAHNRHVAAHAQDKPNLCTVCGKTFCKGYRLQDHMLTHSNEKPFECEICLKKFSKSANLKMHVKTHTGARPYVCNLCGKTYTTQSNLSTHMSNHTGKKPHVCGACGKSFVHPRLLRIHVRIHTGEKPYKCNVCNKSFAKNIHLTTHMRTHTGERPYICFKCGKGFTTSGNLSAHRKVHHQDCVDDKTDDVNSV